MIPRTVGWRAAQIPDAVVDVARSCPGGERLAGQKIGGSPLNPYQPAGVWEETSFGNKKYRQDSGENLYRRSLYTFWRRIAPPTAFFDNSGRQICQVRPLRTNTPLHALYTLNGVTFVEAARVLAERALIAQPADRCRHASISSSPGCSRGRHCLTRSLRSHRSRAHARAVRRRSGRGGSIPVYR